MNIARNPENIAEGLTVPERTLLFCVAGATDWQDALGVTDDTVTATAVDEFRGSIARLQHLLPTLQE
jgi:hypothetical protein